MKVYLWSKDSAAVALRSLLTVAGDTFIARLYEAESLVLLDEVDAIILPVTDDEAEVILSHRSVFKFDTTMVVGSDGLSLWWLNTADGYGSILLDALVEEDRTAAEAAQRRKDILGESAVSSQITDASLVAESRIRRSTKRRAMESKSELAPKLDTLQEVADDSRNFDPDE